MRPIRVVIADRNDITRKGVAAIIADAGQPYQVAAAFARLRDAEQHIRDHPADILVIEDQTLSPMEVIRLVNHLHETHPGLGVVVMSQRRDGDYINGVMRWGSAGFILKNGRLEEELLKALQLVSEKYVFVSPEAYRLNGSHPPGKLKHRDREVLRLLEQEMSIQEIAAHLGVSDKTVYRSRDKLKKHLSVRNNDRLVDAARKQGLLDRKD